MALCGAQSVYNPDTLAGRTPSHLLLIPMAAQAISLANVLPTEVLEYILGELPTDDLEKCKLVRISIVVTAGLCVRSLFILSRSVRGLRRLFKCSFGVTTKLWLRAQ